MKSTLLVFACVIASSLAASAAPSLLSGRIYDKKTGANLVANVVITNAATGESYLDSHSNSTTGMYTAVITSTSTCNLKLLIDCEGYASVVKTMKFNFTGEYQELTFDVALERKKIPAVKAKPAKKKKGISQLWPTLFMKSLDTFC